MTLICAYCDEEFDVPPEAYKPLIYEHYKTCSKHPMAEIVADNKRLRDTVTTLQDQVISLENKIRTTCNRN